MRKQMIDEMLSGGWCTDRSILDACTDEDVIMFYKQFNDQKNYIFDEEGLDESILEALSRNYA